jgi:hypothetical protein
MIGFRLPQLPIRFQASFAGMALLLVHGAPVSAQETLSALQPCGNPGAQPAPRGVLPAALVVIWTRR